MSLCCHECKEVMGPGFSFPGREGTMIYPVVPAIIWLPEQTPQTEQTIVHVEVPENLSLCFECIEKKLPDDRHPLLENIYTAYELDTKYEQIEQALSGKSIRLGGNTLLDKQSEIYQELKNIKDLAFLRACLSCGIELPQNLKPYFIARTIDKNYSSQHTTNFLDEVNYSFTNLKIGTVSFKFCFNCLQEKFPRIYEDLSYKLRGLNKRSSGANPKNEIHLSSSFLQALQDENSEEIQKSLDEISNDPQTDIFIRPEIDRNLN